MRLSDREYRTVLAALQCWTGELGFHAVADETGTLPTRLDATVLVRVDAEGPHPRHSIEKRTASSAVSRRVRASVGVPDMNGSRLLVRRKFIYPLSTRRKMAAAKVGKPLSAAHKRAVSRGLRAWHKKKKAGGR